MKNNIFNFIKIFIVLLLIALFIYKINGNKNSEPSNLINYSVDESKTANVTEIFFYGNHFNIKGNIDNIYSNLEQISFYIVSIDKKYEYNYVLNYDVNDNIIYFNSSNLLNEGIILDGVNINEYNCYIKILDNNSQYIYEINNQTKYNDFTYYSIFENGNNKKIQFLSSNGLILNVSLNKDDVYDIIIDPGHGGKDLGACYNKICETRYTLLLSNLLKSKLEKLGYKVALTRDSDIYLEKYGVNSRVEKVYKSKAKILISIHLNSTYSKLDGFEVYTSNNINLDFARNIVSNLKSIGGLNTSNNSHFKVEDGIYSRTFSSTDVIDANKNFVYPNVSTNTNYYFMIRETGGYMAGAYVDGRDGNGENIYRNNNVGIESYILELGYINNPDNINEIENNKEKYMNNLAETIDNYLKKKSN